MVESGIAFSGHEHLTRDPLAEHRNEVVKGMNPFIKTRLGIFSSPDRVWQPSDFYPDESEIKNRKLQAAGLSQDVLVVIAGAFVTENALPTYQSWLNRIEAVKDETGTDTTPWATGNRLWTADESRHPVSIRDWMLHSGRFNMRNIDIISQHLIRNGFDPGTDRDPYKSIGYVSIQEPATHASHSGTANMTKEQGDTNAYDIFIRIAGDEARHTAYYQSAYQEITRLDPDGATIALRDVLRKRIDMPGKLMTHNGDIPDSDNSSELYDMISDASKRSGIYTPQDYVRIVVDFIELCKIEHLTLTDDEAKIAQEEIGRLNRMYTIAAERFTPRQFTSDTSLACLLLK